MPIVRVELLTGRSAETKTEVAREITKVLKAVAGIKPSATTVIFTEVSPSDWVVAGEPLNAGLQPK
ncbi:tautomerase family protein [Ensifer sp. BR816]|uniref:tautomerase family protein n=1 Tax=Rhizobium sp. (strain BR816) TaxID=1057002 RepID=UPI00037280D9|nr:tautomerase family protein [Ensifer sp. BR816]